MEFDSSSNRYNVLATYADDITKVTDSTQIYKTVMYTNGIAAARLGTCWN